MWTAIAVIASLAALCAIILLGVFLLREALLAYMLFRDKTLFEENDEGPDAPEGGSPGPKHAGDYDFLTDAFSDERVTSGRHCAVSND